eukprot:scaffold2910_cov390-Prasinococcus_capsulatus_cf.AAC.69
MFEFAAGFPLQFHLLEVCFPCVLSIACQGIQWDSSVPHLHRKARTESSGLPQLTDGSLQGHLAMGTRHLLCVEEQHAEPRHIHEDQSHIAGIERATRAVAASDGCACTPVNVWLWARHDPEGLHVAIDKDPYVQEADHVIVCQPSRLSRLLLLLQLAALHRVVVQHAQAVQHACAQLASREAISVDQCTRRLLVCGASARHPHEHVAVIAARMRPGIQAQASSGITGVPRHRHAVALWSRAYLSGRTPYACRTCTAATSWPSTRSRPRAASSCATVWATSPSRPESCRLWLGRRCTRSSTRKSASSRVACSTWKPCFCKVNSLRARA